MWKFYWSELDPIKWPHSKSWFGQFEFEPGLGVRSTWAPPPSSAWPSSRAAGWPGRRGAGQPLHPPARKLEVLKKALQKNMQNGIPPVVYLLNMTQITLYDIHFIQSRRNGLSLSLQSLMSMRARHHMIMQENQTNSTSPLSRQVHLSLII